MFEREFSLDEAEEEIPTEDLETETEDDEELGDLTAEDEEESL